MTRRALATLLAAALFLSIGGPAAAQADGATDYVRTRIERIYDLLGSSGAPAPPDRRAAARRTLDELFDWTEMGRQALGPYWKERTPAERTEFVQLFAALFQWTYLSRIGLADRAGFQYLGETSEGDTAVVKTAVVTQKGRQIPVDYVARRAGEQWRVHDLSVAGTSLVNNYRAQFTSLVARSSYQDLIQKLREMARQRPGAAGPPTAVLVGAGDIATCTGDGDEATASLLDSIDGVVFTLGDHAYEAGTSIEFAACYEPSWGRHKARTRPAPGNHDYLTPAAAGYFAYFGDRAGDPGRGYYSYVLGAWHIVALNSNCAEVGGCGPGSAQERWLRADLAARRSLCTLAYWHHPRFSSGPHGGDPAVEAFWRALHEHGAEIVLAGHDHTYERFAPQTPDGVPDPARGIRQFIVGTGGGSHHRFEGPPAANSEVRNDDTFGVLELRLGPAGYEWRFLPVGGATFTDSGRGRCH
ncbi:MAG TPA: ABC transporter substrate-binding protein [Methylomirabilota bacterium]|nr:ABC transporter substrate-binding protein [Methylomirabilota bacterium]